MRFLCLVYFENTIWDSISPEEDIRLTDESLAYDGVLARGGHFIAANALQPTETATTLRVRNGQVTSKDGPFAETKEVLGGFILIEARDKQEALTLAAGIPMARYGSIEVRPIQVLTASTGGAT